MKSGPVTNEMKHEAVFAELRRDPTQSNRAIGRLLNMSHTMVANLRRQLDNPSAPPPHHYSHEEMIRIREKIAAFIADHPTMSDVEIASQIGVNRKTVQRVRTGAVTDASITINIPEGQTIQDAIRRGLQYEDAGYSSEDAARQVSISARNYRWAKDIVRLLDIERLPVDDRKRVETAVAWMEKFKRVKPAFEQVKDIVERVWGQMGGIKSTGRERKLIDKYMTVLVVLAEAAEQARNAIVPYLDQDDFKRAEQDLADAEAAIRKARKNLEGQSHA